MTAYARLAPLWITAALLIFAPSAHALIQVDAGIAGARLGNTREQVRAALGKPIKIRTLKNDFGPYVEYRFSGGIRVTFQGKTNVTAVTTTGKGDLNLPLWTDTQRRGHGSALYIGPPQRASNGRVMDPSLVDGDDRGELRDEQGE